MIPLPRALVALLAAGVAAGTITNGVLVMTDTLHPERIGPAPATKLAAGGAAS